MFEGLPVEIVSIVFAFLDESDLLTLSLVSRIARCFARKTLLEKENPILQVLRLVWNWDENESIAKSNLINPSVLMRHLRNAMLNREQYVHYLAIIAYLLNTTLTIKPEELLSLMRCKHNRTVIKILLPLFSYEQRAVLFKSSLKDKYIPSKKYLDQLSVPMDDYFKDKISSKVDSLLSMRSYYSLVESLKNEVLDESQKEKISKILKRRYFSKNKKDFNDVDPHRITPAHYMRVILSMYMNQLSSNERNVLLNDWIAYVNHFEQWKSDVALKDLAKSIQYFNIKECLKLEMDIINKLKSRRVLSYDFEVRDRVFGILRNIYAKYNGTIYKKRFRNHLLSTFQLDSTDSSEKILAAIDVRIYLLPDLSDSKRMELVEELISHFLNWSNDILPKMVDYFSPEDCNKYLIKILKSDDCTNRKVFISFATKLNLQDKESLFDGLYKRIFESNFLFQYEQKRIFFYLLIGLKIWNDNQCKNLFNFLLKYLSSPQNLNSNKICNLALSIFLKLFKRFPVNLNEDYKELAEFLILQSEQLSIYPLSDKKIASAIQIFLRYSTLLDKERLNISIGKKINRINNTGAESLRFYVKLIPDLFDGKESTNILFSIMQAERDVVWASQGSIYQDACDTLCRNLLFNRNQISHASYQTKEIREEDRLFFTIFTRWRDLIQLRIEKGYIRQTLFSKPTIEKPPDQLNVTCQEPATAGNANGWY